MTATEKLARAQSELADINARIDKTRTLVTSFGRAFVVDLDRRHVADVVLMTSRSRPSLTSTLTHAGGSGAALTSHLDAFAQWITALRAFLVKV